MQSAHIPLFQQECFYLIFITKTVGKFTITQVNQENEILKAAFGKSRAASSRISSLKDTSLSSDN